jgi:hypothetical protein
VAVTSPLKLRLSDLCILCTLGSLRFLRGELFCVDSLFAQTKRRLTSSVNRRLYQSAIEFAFISYAEETRFQSAQPIVCWSHNGKRTPLPFNQSLIGYVMEKNDFSV